MSETQKSTSDNGLDGADCSASFGIWMPIETAPHDQSTWVIVVEKDGDTHIAIYDTHPLDPSGEEMDLCWTDVHMEVNPTHWMPLPIPPNVKHIHPEPTPESHE